MAKINYDFYDNLDIYDDGVVEKKLLNHYKNGKSINLEDNGVFYLTTDVRSNILNWYPFKKNDDVLEIGCGCGTLTGMLCDRCHSVYSVEGSKRRAEITYYRHFDKDNLNVFVGNFEKIKFNKKFDYIILIGVFEYSKRFFKRDFPFDYFLEKIKKMLKSDGKVLLAIENRYGLKYWVGCNEDHLGRPYVGLEGYDNTDIQTFGKGEFIDLLLSHKFVKYKFFYPFPDYKLPSVIYSDKRLPKIDEINNIPFYFYGGNENFDVHRTLVGLLDNKVFDFFSNSFLVEFGLDGANLSDIIYAKNLSYRNYEYKTITLENEEHKFYKIVDNKFGVKHLESFAAIHNKLMKKGIKASSVELKEKVAFIEYIYGDTFGEYIKSFIRQKRADLIEIEIDKVVSFYKSISTYKKISSSSYSSFVDIYKNKDYFLKVSIVDGNVSNIIIDEKGDYVFIDQEWEARSNLPAEYLIYYSLLYIFSIDNDIFNYFSFNYFCKKYNITEEKIAAFRKFEHDYYCVENKVIDANKKKELDSCMYSSSGVFNVLYYDVGNDFNEKHKIIGTYKCSGDNTFSVTFDLPNRVKRVRFDPQIGGNKFVFFDNIVVNKRKIMYDEFNIIKFHGRSTLLAKYPFIVFPFKRKKLTISICFSNFTKDDIMSYLNDSFEKTVICLKEIDELKSELNNLKNKEANKFFYRLKRKIFRKFKVFYEK